VPQRQHRDAEVKRLAAEVHGHASVLRDAALGDVERSHDLQPTRHGGLHVLGDVRDVAHHAVDAHADEEPVALRLEVQVRGAFLDRVREQAVDERDRRSARRHVADVVDALHLLACVLDDGQLDPRAVRAVERLVELCLLGHDWAERDAERELEVVDRAEVRGVGDGEPKHAVLREPDRQRVEATRERRRQKLDRLGVDVDVVQVDQLEPALLGDRACDLPRREQAELRDDRSEAAAVVALCFERLLELGDAQQA
jgi:hypothetical protein